MSPAHRPHVRLVPSHWLDPTCDMASFTLTPREGLCMPLSVFDHTLHGSYDETTPGPVMHRLGTNRTRYLSVARSKPCTPAV